jgi:glucose-6-phosphate dehydrogenase assembly protein OpcA
MVLAVPRLTPSGAIARWRMACMSCLTDPAIAAETEPRSVSLLSDRAAEQAVSSVLISDAAATALRGWLAMRLNWQPS